jgi:hypothetical protein
MNEKEILIACNIDQKKKLRNYELGKEWAGIIYCLVEDCQERCPYKAIG